MKFYRNIREGIRDNSIKKNLASCQITERDAELIREYVAEYQAVKHVKEHRIQKTLLDLVNWRRFILVPYDQCTTEEVYAGINRMMTGKNLNGKQFAQNTKHDYVKALRLFLTWLIENQYSSIPPEKVKQIKVPSRDYVTTTPDEILTSDEITKLIEACQGSREQSRDRAIISTLYESGVRIGELARLKWKDLVFDDYGVQMNITDTKGSKLRYVRLVMSKDRLIEWKNDSHYSTKPDAYVFVSSKGEPMEYMAFTMMIRRTAERAGITKRVNLHLFRKSRITHLIQANFQESVIKKMMWGNLNTNMFQTYVVLSQKDIDDEILSKLGVKKKKEVKGVVLGQQQCEFCLHDNPPAMKYCGKCGQPLDEEERKTLEMLNETARKSKDYEDIHTRMLDMERQLDEIKRGVNNGRTDYQI